MKIPTLAVVPFVALTGSLVLFANRAPCSTLPQRAHADPTDGAHQTPAAPSPAAETQRPGRDAGSGQSVAVSGLPDVVPLPEPAVYAPGADGDVLVSPASGDPYFLGFAAGKHYPAADERIDPDLIRSVRSFYDDGRPQQTTYAFVMMQRRITPERVAELESLGVRVLGFHPHYCLKVALPTSAIELVAAHPAVRWVGVAKDWQKVHPMLTAQLATAQAGDSVDVWINLFESDLGPDSRSELEATLEEAGPGGIAHSLQDQSQGARRWMSNGWQQRALQQAGLEVVEYVDSLRAFRARLAPSTLSMVTALDCVQFVEPVLAEEALHDESIPLIHSDATRGSYSGGTNSVAIIGQIDTGLFNGHLGLNQLWGIGSDFTGSGTGAWIDECGHGSHVAGTITGDASVDASLAGNAPGLGWGATGRYFNAKWLVNASPKCVSNSALSGPLNFMHTPFTDANGNVTPIPHVVNNSWGASGVFFGTEATPRAIDDEVYSHDQMYVFSAGNNGPAGNTITSGGSAKNAFTVGSVMSGVGLVSGIPGELANSSSRGPTADLRWKPNVVAPGDRIMSVDATTTNGYTIKSGTSMAAPHVTGVAAQLVDHYPGMRYAPARLASLLMANATTKDNAVITSPSVSSNDHLNEFGAGRIDAYRANWNTSQLDWQNWGFDQNAGGYTYNDFTVNAGATRLIMVFSYVEPQASAGASQALIDDYDLFLDEPPVDPNAGNTGEYTAQQSNINNTEIRILDNPTPGTWRWKSFPENVVSNDDVHASVTIAVIYGDTTPAIDLDVTASDLFVKPGDHVDLTATVTNPDFVASAVYLDTDITFPVGLSRSTTTLEDGAVTDLTHNDTFGWDVVLGDIRHGLDRTAEWTVWWNDEGVKNFTVDARCDNAPDRHQERTITVDGTAPGLVTNLASPTHNTNIWSNDGHIQYTWVAAVDNLSGIDGYSISTSVGGPSNPATTKNLPNVETFAQNLSSGAAGYYFNIRAVDLCGNWGATKSRGPFLIDTVNPGSVGPITSTTHTAGIVSCSSSLDVNWGAATDAHSGIAGYRVVIDQNALTIPTQSDPLITGTSTSLSPIVGTWYVHVRAEDLAGNLGLQRHGGPFITTAPPATYCTAKVNSLGCTPSIVFTGTPRASATSGFTILCANVRNNKSGLLFYGTSGSAATPFQGGTLCVAAPIKRTPAVNSGGTAAPANDCSGAYSIDFITFAHGLLGGSPLPSLITPGTDVWVQWWGRDSGFPAPNNTTLSNGLSFEICQ